jgi:hypothetical protein
MAELDEFGEEIGTYVIEDWMGHRKFPDKTFDSFQEARGFISDWAEEHKEGNTEAERERDYNGICEDFYAVLLKEDN